MRWPLLAMLTVLCACGESADMRPPLDETPRDRPDASDGAFAIDQDGDGLCDQTEVEFGTDPEQSDSDSDGIPDLIELGNGFDATDSLQPGADQLAQLAARPSATLDFPIRVTLEGTGEGVSGRFTEMGSFYTDMSSALEFFRAGIAVAADPVDAVRSIDAEAARFRSVLGRTRLEFSLRFTYARPEPLTCTRAYPFGYVLESDSGELVAEGLFLLVVSPSDGATHAGREYCLPAGCQ
jgi:hypothetical protein